MRRMFGFLIGVFVGGVVGSSIALLMAPESGENLRLQLRNRGQSLANDIRHSADVRRIELRNRLETMRAPREM
jgi:gas vesicle protein